MKRFEQEVFFPLSEVALFLDLDGTLASIAALPEDVVAEPMRNALLRHIGTALSGRLAIISGREVSDVDRILESNVACVAGLHGLERRSATGQTTIAEPHPEIAKALPVIQAFAQSRPALLIEDKKLAIAIHYRQMPEAANDVLAFARRIAWATGLKLQEGRMVAELRSPGPHKGDMVEAFMRERPFAEHVPIFIGDDITDEDGFAAATGLGGVGVLVGSARETHASARLESVSDVHRWLGAALESGSFSLKVKS